MSASRSEEVPTRAVPSARLCVTRELLSRALREHPDRVFAKFAASGLEWTYAQLHREVASAAQALRRRGIAQGDLVLCWLPNGAVALRTWLALNCLGAVYVPLNPSYRGAILEHMVHLTRARSLIVHPAMVGSLPVSLQTQLQQVLVAGGSPEENRIAQQPSVEPTHADAAELPLLERDIQPWDSPAVIFTSGTTGPSKAVQISYAQLWATVSHSPSPAQREDRYLQFLPLFHISGMSPVFRALTTGASIGVIERFHTATFWADVLRVGATEASIMGTIAAFLLDLPVSDEERLTPLKKMMLSPLTEETIALAKRIGASWHTWFNMTEVSRPLISGMNPSKPGHCGQPRAGIEARLVDDNDCEVEGDGPGELVLRADAPWSMNSGYLHDPQATALAWRNGWFHTGDLFRKDAEGDYFFVDRKKDAIRRRGENISSFEVEREVLAFPGVKACAAIGIPSAQGDQEVLVALEPQQGAVVDPGALIDFLLPRMPHFMVPRYVRIVAEFPRTPTHRIRKDVLKSEGLASPVWDRLGAQAGERA